MGLTTRVTPPATGHLLRDASDQTEQHNADARAEHATSDPWFDERTPTRAEAERDEAGWDW